MRERDDELRRHLGTLWKTALVGLDTVREVVIRSTQSGRLRVDVAFLQRERAHLLQELGAIVARMMDDDRFADSPGELRDLRARIKDVDERLRDEPDRAHDNASGAPRGFEPEAAADYGDEELGSPSRHGAPRKSRKRSAKRKETAR